MQNVRFKHRGIRRDAPVRPRIALAALALVAPFGAAQIPAQAADLSSSYSWQPVRLGAGGYVTGFVTHPLDANKRYARTDVGNAYRWDTSKSEWIPMLVRVGNTGMPASAATTPGNSGVDSIAVDPSNTSTLFIAFPVTRSSDVSSYAPTDTGTVYKSTDSGINFSATPLKVKMLPNGSWRSFGERLNVDPRNGQIVYYGSVENGLYRSTDGGASWSQLNSGGAPSTTSNVIGIRFAPTEGTATLAGKTVSKGVYAIVGNGSVFKSNDGGANWSNISSGQTIDGKAGFSTVDKNGVFYVIQTGSRNLWKYTGSWTSYTVAAPQNLQGVAVDPVNPSNIWTVAINTGISRSSNGGTNWTQVSTDMQYANTFAWLPQQVAWRANGGIYYDKNGMLWVPQGNEGVLKYQPTNTETSSTPPRWTIESKGIEEFIMHDVIVPKGGGGKFYATVQDGTGFQFTNPDTFSAKHIPIANQFLNVSNSISVCPNNSSFLAIATADAHKVGNQQCNSGYTTDGGTTWYKFQTYPWVPERSETIGPHGNGTIAVSRRGSWSAGNDHMVWMPSGNHPPYYSKDGGKTWTRNTTFPVWTQADVDAGTAKSWQRGTLKNHTGFWNVSLKQRQLKADPFVADKYYLKLTWPGFWISTDGGVTWTRQTSAGLPEGTHHGDLAVNMNVQNDIWFADGWEGSYGGSGRGLYRSTNGGTNFSRISGIDNAITVALGASRGQSGDAAFTVYFYGKLTNDSLWGIFRSTNAGASWDRISGFPMGNFDQPTCLGASWDTFGLVYLGTAGNSLIYGKIASTQGANLVSNPGFEAEQFNTQTPSGWSETQYDSNWNQVTADASYSEGGNAKSGNYHGVHWKSSAYRVYTYQTKTGLTNGLYTLRAWVRRSSAQPNACQMEAKNYDGTANARTVLLTDAKYVSFSTYQLAEIKDINVTNGQCTIGFWTDHQASGWVYFDDVEFFKQ